jgi:dUTP pyrophosphatase
MKIKIKRFDKSLPLPAHQSAGAAAFDMTAREEVTIAPGAIGYVPLNIALEIPPQHFLLVAARSSTHKKGIMMGNGIGIIDPDFSGDKDEVTAVCYNFTGQPVTIEKGFRIAQGTFIPVPAFEWDEVDALPNKTRGWLGTTGNK